MRSKVLEICLNFKSFFGQSLLLWIFGTMAQFISYFCLCYATTSNTSVSLILAWHRAMESCQMFLTVSCDFDEWMALWSLKNLSVSLQGWTIVPSPLWLEPTVILTQVHNCFTLLCQSHVHIKSCCLIKYCILYIFVYIIYISSLLFYRMEDWPRRHT